MLRRQQQFISGEYCDPSCGAAHILMYLQMMQQMGTTDSVIKFLGDGAVDRLLLLLEDNAATDLSGV